MCYLNLIHVILLLYAQLYIAVLMKGSHLKEN